MPTRITSSPWGAVQHQAELAEGIIQVSTASHGGIWLSPERQREASAKMQGKYKTFLDTYRWWEEDCDAAIVVLIFQAEMKPEWVEAAKRSLEAMRNWDGDYQSAYDILIGEHDESTADATTAE